MKLTFLGAARTVTGSFFVLETDQSRFAVDCGLFQGLAEIRERNYQAFLIDPASLDFMLLTHAHIDHIGLIPKLCLNGFTGPIYCTYATADLASILLPDSAHIQESEVERKNRKALRSGKQTMQPIYTVEDAQKCLQQFKPLHYDEMFSPAKDIRLQFRDAGHILGSAMIEMWVAEKNENHKLIFSGDLGNYSQRIIKDPTFLDTADVLFIESTYGDRLHRSNGNRIDQLLEAIEFTRQKGGNLVIPAFAVERTQDLIYDLNILNQQGKLPAGMPVFIDSPLAIAATEIFQQSRECYDEETLALLQEGMDPFSLPQLKFARSKEESSGLNEVMGAIIISASGMCDAGRIKHHLKHNLWRPESTILFVGYQAVGTLGRRLLEGEKLVRIHGEDIAVKADIRQLESYSAHADQAGIMKWLKGFKSVPKEIFLVHGEGQAQETLSQLIEKEFQVKTYIPGWQDQVEIGQPVETKPEPVAKPVVVQPDAALQAEQAYYQFRADINRFFQSKWEAGEYDQLIKAINNAKQCLEK
ncbi:MAG: MBL fold metallo-hydrolase RNA specificity domain-containing protein [Chitinophagales bacterium]